MKKVMLILVVIMTTLLGGVFAEGNKIEFTNSKYLEDTILEITPCRALVFYGKNGKTAKVDFSCDKVVYSGDMPVDESARVFFDAVLKVYKQENKNGK
jgi:uncharacterized protein YxeA